MHNSERTPDVSDATPSTLSPTEAFERYAHAFEKRDGALKALHTELSADRDVMRVLYLTYLDLGKVLINDRAAQDAIDQADQRGWIAGTRPALTRDGLFAFWDWKERIAPHARDPWFQSLWREVVGW